MLAFIPTLKKRIARVSRYLWYSFPVQLLVLHLRQNMVLLLFWVLLFAVVTGGFGQSMGVPYLFLDPEYLNHIGFLSFAIVGAAMSGFIMTFHMISYIITVQRFPFLAHVYRPFLTFCINNSAIPALFIAVYVAFLFSFRNINYPDISTGQTLWHVLGLLVGAVAIVGLFLGYFKFTNKASLSVAGQVNRQLMRYQVTRVNVMQKYKGAQKQGGPQVLTYLNHKLRLKARPHTTQSFDRQAVLRVFNQHHLNVVGVQALIVVSLLVLGQGFNKPSFQIPAAASGFLFLSVLLMLAGAIYFWFRKWAVAFVLALTALLNIAVKNNVVNLNYEALGLDYSVPRANYTLERLETLTTPQHYKQDTAQTLQILNRWKARVSQGQPAGYKPPMVITAVSGGGQRSALWALNVLQAADSLTQGKLMKYTALMTGSSGGLIGAAYYRELYYQHVLGKLANHNDPTFQDSITQDNLNSVIFTLTTNDLFFGPLNILPKRYTYQGRGYSVDRGLAFEEQLNTNINGRLDHPLVYYKEPEAQALIPLMLVSPTVLNDGRKLYISPQGVSYLGTTGRYNDISYTQPLVKGIEFRRFFEKQNADSLRFLSALRMSATFPYVTPNIQLPSNPPMSIMDAGVADNYGLADAINFAFVFRHWIKQNVSNLIIVSIRDSQKREEIEGSSGRSLVSRMVTPIQGVARNLANVQDINNENKMAFAQDWLDSMVVRVDIQYNPYTIIKARGFDEKARRKRFKELAKERASLSWHLTSLEKQNIKGNIDSAHNAEALHLLEHLLEYSTGF